MSQKAVPQGLCNPFHKSAADSVQEACAHGRVHSPEPWLSTPSLRPRSQRAGLWAAGRGSRIVFSADAVCAVVASEGSLAGLL